MLSYCKMGLSGHQSPVYLQRVDAQGAVSEQCFTRPLALLVLHCLCNQVFEKREYMEWLWNQLSPSRLPDLQPREVGYIYLLLAKYADAYHSPNDHIEWWLGRLFEYHNSPTITTVGLELGSTYCYRVFCRSFLEELLRNLQQCVDYPATWNILEIVLKKHTEKMSEDEVILLLAHLRHRVQAIMSKRKKGRQQNHPFWRLLQMEREVASKGGYLQDKPKLVLALC